MEDAMHIACVNNHGIPYLQVMESYSIKEDGIYKSRKRVVKNLGPLSRFDDGKPDYLKRLRHSFKEGNPLIPELYDLVTDDNVKDIVTIQFDRKSQQDCVSDPKNIGYFLLDGLYDGLGIYDVMNKYKSMSKIEYDLNGLTKLLVFGRVLWPDSKVKTFKKRDRYFFDVTSSNNLIEVYRALDCLNDEAESIQKRINHKVKNSIGRNMEVCFYDVTNYYFEIDQNDEDILDTEGNVIKDGLRKKGVSKEKRSDPIVQMGLFIDDNGIPIAYQLFPGNKTDQTTLRPALKKGIDNMKFGKVIIVADGGLNNSKNIAHILKKGNGYILSKSTKKSAKNVRKWILEEEGYEWNEKKTFKVKSILQDRTVEDEDGNKIKYKEKLICYWSKKHYDMEVNENKKFIEYLESIIENPDKLKDKPKKIEKFLNKTQIDKNTGEILNVHTHLSLDIEKIQEYMNLMGYYTIMTSEIEKTDREIINKYHGLSRIEDSFKIIKSDLEGRPVHVYTPEHINAHFLICFIALIMVRIIQYRILKYQGKDTLNEDGWEAGLSTERIKEALILFQADNLPDGYCRTTKPSDDLQLIHDSFNINTVLNLPTLTELRQFKYTFDKATVI
jgi:transposase